MTTKEGIKLIIKVQKEMGYKIGKDATADVGKFSYDYVSLPVLYKQLHKILDYDGFILTQPLDNVNGQPAVTTSIYSPNGEEVLSSTFTFNPMNNPQDVGKSITYFRRYSLMGMFGFISSDDDDAISTIPMSNTEVKEEIRNAKSITDLTKLFRVISNEQKEYFKDMFTKRRESIEFGANTDKKAEILEATKKSGRK